MPVDPSKLKTRARQRLGAPPTDGNPEIAPPGDTLVSPRAEDPGTPPAPATPQAPAAQTAQVPAAPARPDPVPGTEQGFRPTRRVIDGRTLRRTGRTVQFATRVSPGFDGAIRELAVRRGCLIVEVLEDALAAYERLAAAAGEGEPPLAVLDRVMAQRRAAKA